MMTRRHDNIHFIKEYNHHKTNCSSSKHIAIKKTMGKKRKWEGNGLAQPYIGQPNSLPPFHWAHRVVIYYIQDFLLPPHLPSLSSLSQLEMHRCRVREVSVIKHIYFFNLICRYSIDTYRRRIDSVLVLDTVSDTDTPVSCCVRAILQNTIAVQEM